MSFKKIKDYLPEFYYKFLPDFFDSEIPEESFSKCQECPMICNDIEEFGSNTSKPFSPESKCCTFFPRLPNYFVGAMFHDMDTSLEEGRQRLRDKIKERKGVYPHGIYPIKKYSHLYEWGRVQGFGKSKYLKCPYYLDGKYNCSVWKYREAICATWFCKTLAQQAGRTFWGSVTAYLKYIQESLILYVLEKENLTSFDPYGEDNNISCEELDDLPMNIKEYSYRWGNWQGKEEEFYLNAYNIINDLSKDEINTIIGIRAKALERELKENYNLIVTIPEMLIPDPARVLVEVTEGKYRIEMKSYIERNDSTLTFAYDLPKIILDSFDGKLTTSEVLDKIDKHFGIKLGKDILISLYHHGVLIKR